MRIHLHLTTIRSVLGLRFRDAATEQPVTRGLRVTVRRTDGLGRSTRAVRTVSGAYIAQGLSGLRAYERSEAAVPEESVSYHVAVDDLRGRFVPILLQVDLPSSGASNGIYSVLETSSDIEAETPDPTCYLFSAVQRPVVAGQAVVYADLIAETAGGNFEPAAHAVLEIRHNSNDGSQNGESVWYGIADAAGRVAVQFALPPVQLEELHIPPAAENNDGSDDGGSGRGRSGRGRAENGNGNGNGNGSPASVGGQPLSSRTWPLTVGVRYQPSALDVPAGADRPLLPSILQQSSGTLYTDMSTSGDELTETLSYRKPLILKTGGLPDNRTALRVAPHDGSS